MTTSSSIKLTRDDYIVGWICALHIELAASNGMLDEVHPDLDRAQGDENIYTLGRIGDHNVVIACLPGGSTGVTPAAKVATDMLRSFPRIRFGLMVGIGGGAPNPNKLPNEDIRLGDIVVSIPEGELGGVVKYDRGKVVTGGEFEHTGLLNTPPNLLTNAVSKLRSKHEIKRNAVSRYVSEMVKKTLESEDVNPDFEDMYKYQGSKRDQLFEADYEHIKPGQISYTSKQSQDTSGNDPDGPKLPCPNCDKARLVARKPRKTNDPVIHYGTIASADRVMRHGATREKLRKKYNILCFEMEAAGLMNNFPCLVIRGICDYSDTHKHKIWQRYAAATAAAYAKELLEVIQKEEVVRTNDAAKVLEELEKREYENTDLLVT
ncbi:purine and uridine phosphorylase [Zopfia rhizophila CBS 207.26]|uniref:Purine and uridine phosphorylase n=1 Tax=Zopfia rhizophila CBS 207.26 TaxID=1314779 RepID=A0A6A6DTW2_9PEZI|nr:purine and uridine phosphorylase [Zopfia rhizophila CBS 207.26]